MMSVVNMAKRIAEKPKDKQVGRQEVMWMLLIGKVESRERFFSNSALQRCKEMDIWGVHRDNQETIISNSRYLSY